jgi:hypothetical protein
MIRAALCLLLLAAPAAATTVQQQSEERHAQIGDVTAHVLPDGTAYAVRGTDVLPLTPDAFVVTNRRVTLTLPDVALTCPLPVAALDEQAGVLRTRTGTTLRTRSRFRLQTWTTDCPDGPAVIWKATDHSTLTTKGP